METLKNILFAIQSTMGAASSPVSTTPAVTPTSSQKQALRALPADQVGKSSKGDYEDLVN